jgi:hypothetical protein
MTTRNEDIKERKEGRKEERKQKCTASRVSPPECVNSKVGSTPTSGAFSFEKTNAIAKATQTTSNNKTTQQTNNTKHSKNTYK